MGNDHEWAGSMEDDIDWLRIRSGNFCAWNETRVWNHGWPMSTIMVESNGWYQLGNASNHEDISGIFDLAKLMQTPIPTKPNKTRVHAPHDVNTSTSSAFEPSARSLSIWCSGRIISQISHTNASWRKEPTRYALYHDDLPDLATHQTIRKFFKYQPKKTERWTSGRFEANRKWKTH